LANEFWAFPSLSRRFIRAESDRKVCFCGKEEEEEEEGYKRASHPELAGFFATHIHRNVDKTGPLLSRHGQVNKR